MCNQIDKIKEYKFKAKEQENFLPTTHILCHICKQTKFKYEKKQEWNIQQQLKVMKLKLKLVKFCRQYCELNKWIKSSN